MSKEDERIRNSEKIAASVVAEQLGLNIEAVRPESTSLDLGADSLDEVEIVMALEEEFNAGLSDDEVERCDTFADICKLIVSKRGCKVDIDTWRRINRVQEKRRKTNELCNAPSDSEKRELTPLAHVMHSGYMTRAVEEFVCNHTEIISLGMDSLYGLIKQPHMESSSIAVVMSGRVDPDDLSIIETLLNDGEYTFVKATENVEKGETCLKIKTVIHFGLPEHKDV